MNTVRPFFSAARKRSRHMSGMLVTLLCLGASVTGCSFAAPHASAVSVVSNSTADAQDAGAAVLTHRKVLYVTRLKHRDREEDDKIVAWLEARGMIVTLADQNSPVSAARGQDLVIISSVVSARDMAGTAFATIPVPLLTWEADLFDSLRFTGRIKGQDFGEVAKEHYVQVVNAPSPLAGGVSNGKHWVYPRDQEMGWGKPAPAATVVATLSGEPTHAVVFAYEKGAVMDYDFVAPARRVALFLGNRTFEQLSVDGLAFFNAGLIWALSAPAVPPAPLKP